MAGVLHVTSPFRCSTSVNIRRDCKRDPRTLGNYVGALASELLPERTFWELARAYKADLVSLMRERQHLRLALRQPWSYSLQLTTGLKTHPHADNDPGIGSDLAISNRGAFHIASKAHRITAVHWVRQHRADNHTDFLLLNACSVNGVLCLTLCYKHPIVEDLAVVAIADALMDQLVGATDAVDVAHR